MGKVIQEDSYILTIDGDTVIERTLIQNEFGEETAVVEVYNWLEGADNEYYAYDEELGIIFTAKISRNKITIVHENVIALILNK